MEYTISSTYNSCRTKQDFYKLLSEYDMLKKYMIKYNEETQKTYIEIDNYKIVEFIDEIGEYISISTINKNIVIDDNHI